MEDGRFGDYCNLSVYIQGQVAKLTLPLPNSLSEGLLEMRLGHYKHYNRLARRFAKQLIYQLYMKLKDSIMSKIAGRNVSLRVPKEAHGDQHKTKHKDSSQHW